MSCTPTLSQNAFRGRNDDGNETTATWKGTGADNENWTQLTDQNFRIRLHVQVTNACAAANVAPQLQYSLNTGTWTTVNASSSVVRSSASPNLADAANTTDQMTTGTGTFIGANGFDEVDGLCGGANLDIAASGHTEVEFCVQIRSADVNDNDTVQLRVSATNLASWTQIPSITVDKPITTTLTADKNSLSFSPNVAAVFKETFLAERNVAMAFTGKTATFSQQRILTAEKAAMGFIGREALFETIIVQGIPPLTMAPYRAA